MFSAALFAACGGQEESSNSSLDQLISKRDSLKNELAEVNDKIAELDTTKAEYLPIVSAEPVEIRDFVHKIEVQGTVETDQNAQINAEANGVIKKIYVKEGQEVRQGQALVMIDSEILSSNIEEVETSLELATYMFEKQQKLMDEGIGVEIEYEQAKNQKRALEKKLQTMRSQRGKSTVRAPFSGVVDEINVSLGEMASPQFPLMRIVNNKDVSITASLSENLLSYVQVGTAVELVIPSLRDTTIYSKIATKGNYIDPVNRTFLIRIDISKNKLLLPNQLAKVHVTDFVKKDAMVIHSGSILQDMEGKNYVFKMIENEDGNYGVERVYIEVLKRYKGYACINLVKEGTLKESDKVVVEGAKGITPSDIVKLQ